MEIIFKKKNSFKFFDNLKNLFRQHPGKPQNITTLGPHLRGFISIISVLVVKTYRRCMGAKKLTPASASLWSQNFQKYKFLAISCKNVVWKLWYLWGHRVYPWVKKSYKIRKNFFSKIISIISDFVVIWAFQGVFV